MKIDFKYILLFFGLLFGILLNAQTQQPIEKSSKECNNCLHGSHTNESPYQISLKNELPFLATSLGLLGSGLLIKEINGEPLFTIGDLNQLDASQINSFDRGAVTNNSSSARFYSNVTLLSGVALPLYFLTNHHTRSDFFPLLVMGAEVFSITSTLTLNVKFTFNRTRPLAYNPEFSDELRTGETSRLSFFSGHTAQTAGFSFFMAKVITDYHPNMRMSAKIGIWSFAVALPAATGYFRVKGGKHFNTDVITGFAVGAAIGWLVPHLHKKKKDSKVSLTPFNYDGANGVRLTLKID